MYHQKIITIRLSVLELLPF